MRQANKCVDIFIKKVYNIIVNKSDKFVWFVHEPYAFQAAEKRRRIFAAERVRMYMKRLIAIVCALAMVFSFALGAEASELDFLDKEYKSYEATMEMSFKLNKPLTFIGDAVKQEEIPVDLQRLVESMLNAKYTVNMAGEISDDYLKGKVYMEIAADQPIEFSDDLKIGVGVKTRMWIDYDFSSVDNMVYKMIITNPLDGKYYVIDFMTAEDIEEVKQEIVDTLKALDMKAGVKEMAALGKSVLEGNAKITKTGNTVTVTVAGDAVGEYICDMITGLMNSEYFKKASGDTAEIGALDMAVMRETINAIDIFGDEAIVCTYTLDNNGFISATTENVHFDFNIYDLVKKFADPDEDISPITKENSDVDLMVSTKCTYSKINSAKVEMPVLTEENSVVVDLTQDDYYDDTYENIDWDKLDEAYTTSVYGAEMKDESNPDAGMYIPLEGFFATSMWEGDKLTGDIAIDETSGAVTVNCTGRDFESKVIKAQVGSCDYTIDGVAYKSVLPLKVDEETETIWFDAQILYEAFGAEVHTVELSYTKDENGQWQRKVYRIGTKRPNPKYDPNYDPWGDME